MDSTIQIEIEINNKMMEIDIDRNATIHTVKQIISERETVSIEQQKLAYLGQTLSDHRTLADYHISNTDVAIILQRQATNRQFWISFVYFGSFIGLGLFMGAPGPILGDLETQTHSNLGSVSFIFSARAVGYIIGSIIFGLISDKYASHFERFGKFSHALWPLSPHHLFGMCLILLSLCMSVLIYVESVSLLTLVIAVTGICSGGIDCFGNVLLLSLFNTDNEKDPLVDPYMQLLHFAFAIGACLSPLIIEISYQFFHNTYKVAFWLMSIETVIFGIIILFISTPLRTAKKPQSSHTNGTTQSVHSMRSANTNGTVQSHSTQISDLKQPLTNGNGNDDPQQQIVIKYGSFDSYNHTNDNITLSTTTETETTNSSENRKKTWYRIFIVLACAIFLGIYVGSEVSFGAYITTYVITYLGSSASVGRYMSSVYWGGLAFGRLSAVYITKKLKPIHMLVFNLLGCFVASSILFVNDSLNATWVASIFYGFFMASIFECIFKIAEQTVKVDGKYASIMIFGASFGEFIIPTMTGNLMFAFGNQCFVSVTIVLVIVLFCVMLVLLLGIYINDIYKKITQFFEI